MTLQDDANLLGRYWIERTVLLLLVLVIVALLAVTIAKLRRDAIIAANQGRVNQIRNLIENYILLENDCLFCDSPDSGCDVDSWKCRLTSALDDPDMFRIFRVLYQRENEEWSSGILAIRCLPMDSVEHMNERCEERAIIVYCEAVELHVGRDHPSIYDAAEFAAICEEAKKENRHIKSSYVVIGRLGQQANVVTLAEFLQLLDKQCHE